MDAAEQDHVGVGFLRLERQAERVADVIRHVLNFGDLIVVREDDGVAAVFQLAQMFLQRLLFDGRQHNTCCRPLL